jgi:hypothetical protein
MTSKRFFLTTQAGLSFKKIKEKLSKKQEKNKKQRKEKKTKEKQWFLILTNRKI